MPTFDRAGARIFYESHGTGPALLLTGDLTYGAELLRRGQLPGVRAPMRRTFHLVFAP